MAKLRTARRYGLAENLSKRPDKKTQKICGLNGVPHSPESSDGKAYTFSHDVYCVGRILHMALTMKAIDNKEQPDLTLPVSVKFHPIAQSLMTPVLRSILSADPERRPKAAPGYSLCHSIKAAFQNLASLSA